MNIKSILFSIFAIAIFAVVSNAQHVKVIDGAREPSAGHVKVFDGRDGQRAGIYRNINGTWTLLSSDVAVGPAIQAGSKFRVGFSAASIQVLLGDGSARTYQVPCQNRASGTPAIPVASYTVAVPDGAATVTGRITAVDYDQRDVNTERSWKGTCRMLVIKSADGTEYRGMLRFR